MNADRLLALYDRVADAPDAPDAILRLRRFVLDLAVRGKLVEQDRADEPASDLLNRIAAEKARLVKVGEIKPQRKGKDHVSPPARFDLPINWAWTDLQAVCISVTDGDHIPPPKAEKGVPFLVISDVRTQTINYQSERWVPRSYYEALDPSRRPRPGDLLYTLVGSFGIPVEVLDEKEFCVQRHISIIRPAQQISNPFLARIMESKFIFDQADTCATGIAQKTVPLSGLRSFSIPLPPLAEQHRIVAKVDELMTLCDQLDEAWAAREDTRDRLTKASYARLNVSDADDVTFRSHARFAVDALPALTARADQVKRLRQAILDLAVRGKLVGQNPADEPASELLKRIAIEKEKQKRAIRGRKSQTAGTDNDLTFPVPDQWVWVKLGQISLRLHYGFTASASKSRKEVRLLRITDIQNDSVDWSSIPGCEIDADSFRKFALECGDLLIARTGGTIGKTFLVADVPVKSVFASYLIRVQLAHSLLPDYVKLFCRSDVYWDQLRAGSRGGGQPNVNGQTLSNMNLPLPPLAEQHRIVAKVNEFMALCDRLEASLNAADSGRLRLLESLFEEALEPPP